MFQGEDDLFHGHMPFEDEPTRIEQGKARDQTQDKMTVIGIFMASLAGLSRQQVLHDPKHLLDPVALIPGLNQPGPLDRQRHGDQIKQLFTGLVHHHEHHLTIGSTPSSQPHLATPWGMETALPGPSVGFDQVRALDLTAVFKGEGIGAFAPHSEGPLVCVGHMAHQLGVTEPTIGDHHRRR